MKNSSLFNKDLDKILDLIHLESENDFFYYFLKNVFQAIKKVS